MLSFVIVAARYELLRDEGLLEFRRGRGVTVAGSARRVVLARARDLVRYARQHGYDRAELIRIIESIVD